MKKFRGIFESINKKGYFPKELPNAFTTQDFGNHCVEIVEEWKAKKVFQLKASDNYRKKKKSGCYHYKIKESEPEAISCPKKGHERREVHIAHPVPQALLSQEIALNWKHIQKWLARQTYSNDEIRVRTEYDRSVKGINFNSHKIKKAYIEGRSDWIVKTDITRYYPSIYTHSIAWAAYGKENVKSNRNKYKGSLADRLDQLVRAANRNQTSGILVGPETSRIIAEIISSRIDYDFTSAMEKELKSRVDRLQDDWFMGFTTLLEAEEALAKVAIAYRAYNLDINGSKTSIEHVVAHKENQWLSELSAFLYHGNRKLAGARLREFLNLVVRLQSDESRSSVTNYALAVIESQKLDRDDIPIIETFLMKAAILAPSSIDKIVKIIINIQSEHKCISKSTIGDRFLELLKRSIKSGKDYESLWFLYLFRGLSIHIKDDCLNNLLNEVRSSALGLVILDMEQRGLLVKKTSISDWVEKLKEEDVMSGSCWLIAYEAFRNDWIADKQYLMQKPLFAPMASRNVAFYDPRKNVKLSANAVHNRWKGGKRDNLEALKLLAELRGFDFNY